MCLSCASYDPRDEQPTLAELADDERVDRELARQRADADAETRARGGYVPSSRCSILRGALSLTLVEAGCIPAVTAVREGVYRIANVPDLTYVTDRLPAAWWDLREHEGHVWARVTDEHPFVKLTDAWKVDTTDEPPF